jgi:hypothetical protein
MLLGAARGAMLKKTFPWIVFFGVLLLLVFSASSYVQAIDSLLWPIRLGFLPASPFSSLGTGRGTRTIQETPM